MIQYEAETIRRQYPVGTRVKLEHMADPFPVPDGMTGTVAYVDDCGQLHMNWDNGSSLALIPGEDDFRKI